jgi:hypothetical protein
MSGNGTGGCVGRTGVRLSRVARLLWALGVVVLALGPLALATAAQDAGTLTMNARILLQGHARMGSWATIEVDLQNSGPSIEGELRMDAGSQSSTRFSTVVTLPTGAHQVYLLHAQPPTFQRTAKVQLVVNDQVVDSVDVAYLVHDLGQLVVGVIAERPQALVSQIDLPDNQMLGMAPALIPLSIPDLPTRAEGWGTLDRLVWQDTDSNLLSPEQIEALRRWIAGGGRLVIVGGSAGISTLSAFPDDLLPYQPSATVDVDPAVLTPLLGPMPADAAALPAIGGTLASGRPLATSGDRVVAAELGYGSGAVTMYGFDPTTPWLAESDAVTGLWTSALPSRSGDGTLLQDDSQLVQAVYKLPNLALPPISGLLALLAGYIVVIGPINYIVLRRLDRRELAWVTMPVLVLAFAAAAFGYGALLRGTDVAVNEVAIIRGAPDATEATAQVYFGVFSPTRSTYQVDLPQGALLASPMNSEQFGSGAGGFLDLVQGTGSERPSLVRDLTVGTSSLRVVRAELPVAGPRMHVDLTLENSILTGTLQNASDKALQNVAVVLGSSTVVLGDIQPGTTVPVRLPVRNNPFGASLADQVVGASFDDSTEAGIRRSTRYAMLNQLTNSPFDMFGGTLPGDRAVVLAFGTDQVLDVRIGNVVPNRNSNVLYYVPVDIGVEGEVTFSADLVRSSVVDTDAMFFTQDGPKFLSMGAGTATMSYRPIPFVGRFAASEVRMSLGTGGNGLPAGGEEIAPLDEVPEPCTDVTNVLPKGCEPRRVDFLPEVEVFDLATGEWARLPRMLESRGYTLARPERYVDGATGQLLVRFVNDAPDAQVSFMFELALEGTIE